MTRCVELFHMLILHLQILFGEVSTKVFGQVFIRLCIFLLSFKSSLYVLGNSPLPDVSSANIFS